MATLTSQQLKDSYQSLVTIGDSITSDPTSGQLENGLGNPITALGIGTDSPTDVLNISSASNQIGLDTGNQATYGTLDVGHFTNGAFIGTQAGSNTVSDLLRLGTNGTERFKIHSSGDISFRDGATNEAFYWDASEANLLLGTNTDAGVTDGLTIYKASGTAGINFNANVYGADYSIVSGATGADAFGIYDNDASAYRMVIDSSGNVGIGNTSPSSYGKTTIALGAVGGNVLALQKDSGAGIAFYGASFNNTGLLESQSANGDMVFYTGTSGVSEKMRIDASGNVGIGTDSPDASLHVEATAISGGEQIAKFTVSDDSTSYLKISNGTGSNNTFNPSIQTLSSGTFTSRTDVATVTTDTGSTPAYVIDCRLAGGALTSRPILDVGSFGNTKMLIDASGNLDMSAGGGNVIMASGAGIDFSATADAGGMTSELLDDYEEGTWTPAWNFATSGSATLSIDSATYTKIGRVVNVNARIFTSSISSPLGKATLTGLPFTANSAIYDVPGSVAELFRWATDIQNLKVIVINNQSYLEMTFNSATDSLATDLSGSDFDSGASKNIMSISVTYFV